MVVAASLQNFVEDGLGPIMLAARYAVRSPWASCVGCRGLPVYRLIYTPQNLHSPVIIQR